MQETNLKLSNFFLKFKVIKFFQDDFIPLFMYKKIYIVVDLIIIFFFRVCAKFIAAIVNEVASNKL